MTEYLRCDDCDKWADRETMDRFCANMNNALVCKACSIVRRNPHYTVHDNCGNAEDKNRTIKNCPASERGYQNEADCMGCEHVHGLNQPCLWPKNAVLCHHDANGNLIHVDETLKSAKFRICLNDILNDAYLFGKDGEG
jgi:hypothetical protein